MLQQQLQHMQATYLLNTEKLEYNFRVLNEKCVVQGGGLSCLIAYLIASVCCYRRSVFLEAHFGLTARRVS